jgi:hypothetical protein
MVEFSRKLRYAQQPPNASDNVSGQLLQRRAHSRQPFARYAAFAAAVTPLVLRAARAEVTGARRD